MATYLCVKVNSTSVKSYAAQASAAKPYLCVSGGYFPLTTETGTGIKVKANGSVYRIAEQTGSTTTTTRTAVGSWTDSTTQEKTASKVDVTFTNFSYSLKSSRKSAAGGGTYSHTVSISISKTDDAPCRINIMDTNGNYLLSDSITYSAKSETNSYRFYGQVTSTSSSNSTKKTYTSGAVRLSYNFLSRTMQVTFSDQLYDLTGAGYSQIVKDTSGTQTDSVSYTEQSVINDFSFKKSTDYLRQTTTSYTMTSAEDILPLEKNYESNELLVKYTESVYNTFSGTLTETVTTEA